MDDFYSVAANPTPIMVLFRVVNRYVGDLLPMPGDEIKPEIMKAW
jgi:hypothetical protein